MISGYKDAHSHPHTYTHIHKQIDTDAHMHAYTQTHTKQKQSLYVTAVYSHVYPDKLGSLCTKQALLSQCRTNPPGEGISE